MSKYKLEDAHAMSIVHSKTFDIPTNDEIMNIITGDHVKVCASGERFWVRVEFTDFETGTIYGRVDNDLVSTHDHGLKLGDDIELKFHHIYAIHK